MATKNVLSVGEVAKRCGINISALHFYEQKELIKSSRNSGNQRRYSRDVLRRVAIIKSAQKVGISLESVKEAFATLPQNRTPTKSDWQLLAKNWQKELNARIKHLEGIRDLLTGCIGCGCLSMSKCPLYNNNDHLAKKGVGAVLLDKLK